jgi:hypothetical protein
MTRSTAIIMLFAGITLVSLACRKSSAGSGGVIQSISPESGHFGTILTIKGSGFDTVNGIVTIDGVFAQVQQRTESTLIVTVPTTHTGPVVVSAPTIGSTTGPTFTYVDDVLVAGVLRLYPTGYNPALAFYWDNGIPKMLITTVTAGPDAAATGVASLGNDIYVCGYQYYGNKRYAILWKNDSAESLSIPGSQDAQSYAIQASGQHVYVVGYINAGNHDVATVWKDGQPTALLGDTVNSYANAIAIAGSDVYIAGYRAQSQGANRVALYWKNGVATALSDGTADALTTGIVVFGTDLYVSGNIGGGVLWKNGLEQPLGYSTAGLCRDAGGLYVAGNSSGYSTNAGNIWAWGTTNPRYSLGNLNITAITADTTGVYSANATASGNTWVPSYSICTGANSVTTIPLSTFTTQGFGSVSGICLRH